MFEAANGGTILLDEVGELIAEIQPKLLRVLERREVTPLGTTKPRSIDVRIVDATLRDIRAMVNRGAFREDLYYRLAHARSADAVGGRTVAKTSGLWSIMHWRTSRRRSCGARDLQRSPRCAAAAKLSGQCPRTRQRRRTRGAALRRPDDLATGSLVRADHRRREGAWIRARREPPTPHGGDGSIEPFNPAKKTVVSRFERDYLERLLVGPAPIFRVLRPSPAWIATRFANCFVATDCAATNSASLGACAARSLGSASSGAF